MFSETLLQSARRVLDDYRVSRLRLVTAESCTGGLIAALLTEVAGSSDVVERGYVTYSNAAKAECLGVPASMIAAYGAVSQEVARAMAAGAIAHSDADVAVAVTGVAGPGGGSVEKPVGLVHLATARRGGPVTHREVSFGEIGRSEVRLATVAVALEMLSAARSG
jgi:nicotinamide-nucleotide amidase